MATTTIDLDTELSAVNSILGAIGQSPVTTLGTVSETNNVEAYDNPEIAFIYNLLRDANVDTQAEGWHFNTESHVGFPPDGNKHIVYGTDVLSLDLHDNQFKRTMDLVRDPNGFVYDKVAHTNEFDSELILDVLYLRPFGTLPIVFRRYITYRASRVAATQLVANPALVKLIAQQEALARAALMEYECNQGDHSMFGFPQNSVHQTYQPWRNLRR
tara:strand:- start:17 stop:661 length:645 start_codon:yes stop_codon:yes gene_type:complete